MALGICRYLEASLQTFPWRVICVGFRCTFHESALYRWFISLWESLKTPQWALSDGKRELFGECGRAATLRTPDCVSPFACGRSDRQIVEVPIHPTFLRFAAKLDP